MGVELAVAPADAYLSAVVKRYTVKSGVGSAAVRVAEQLVPPMKEWAGRYLWGLRYRVHMPRERRCRW